MYRLFGLVALMVVTQVLSAAPDVARNVPAPEPAQSAQSPHSTTTQLDAAAEKIDELKQPLYNPFIERYFLDELKAIRGDQQALRAEVADRVAEVRVGATDRSVRYATDTVNNIFYIITAALSILVIAGWSSLREARNRVEEVIDSKVNKLTEEYELRLQSIEETLRQRSDEILEAQQAIKSANEIHSLWMRSGLESSVQEKIKIYDEILLLRPEDVEAITYKADAVLELGDCEWAHNLANKAIALDENYALAYWQRACANAELGYTDHAISDIEIAIAKNASLADELKTEKSFMHLRGTEGFEHLLEMVASS